MARRSPGVTIIPSENLKLFMTSLLTPTKIRVCNKVISIRVEELYLRTSLMNESNLCILITLGLVQPLAPTTDSTSSRMGLMYSGRSARSYNTTVKTYDSQKGLRITGYG